MKIWYDRLDRWILTQNNWSYSMPGPRSMQWVISSKLEGMKTQKSTIPLLVLGFVLSPIFITCEPHIRKLNIYLTALSRIHAFGQRLRAINGCTTYGSLYKVLHQWHEHCEMRIWMFWFIALMAGIGRLSCVALCSSYLIHSIVLWLELRSW